MFRFIMSFIFNVCGIHPVDQNDCQYWLGKLGQISKYEEARNQVLESIEDGDVSLRVAEDLLDQYSFLIRETQKRIQRDCR